MQVTCENFSLEHIFTEDLLDPVFEDRWEDAEVDRMLHYLRGAKGLQLPDYLRQFLPVS